MSEYGKNVGVGMRTLRILGVGFLILIFVASALPFDTAGTPQAAPQTPASSAAHPSVPVGGTPVTVTGTYVHPSGMFSVPTVSGWELPGESPEESIAATPDQPITRAGAVFVNVSVASVVHVFVENNPQANLRAPEDLQAYYTSEQVGLAWTQYNGGWREIGRRTEGDTLIIDTEMTHEGLVYLGRQFSRLQDRWLMVMRLVVPNNNPSLLERLQAVYQPHFDLWQTSMSAPMDWRTLADTVSGYLIRFPNAWRQEDGKQGATYTISGELNGQRYRLNTYAVPNTAVSSEESARAWIAANYPRVTIQTVQSETRGTFNGYTVSFLAPDPDGNQRSLVATLLNGESALYVAVLQTFAEGRDLLSTADSSIPPELLRIRQTFTPIRLVPPSAQPTPTPAG
ncbi:MAG: hypothetical protein RML95_00750 [Anaerolineae bacterium]|nr:hypothetical protein [Anaerolineae bacterium]MDW8297845.1 hypothetical protein [Anaerolineae bacterium]